MSERSYDRLRPGRKVGPPMWLTDPALPGFEKAIVFEPGFARNPQEVNLPPSQRYGRCAMSMRFLLRGPRGVAQWLMYTGWTPEREGYYWMPGTVLAADLGRHALTPQYPGEDAYDCDYVPGGRCYFDGSGLAADRVMEDFFDRGEAAVWDALMQVHDEMGADHA